MRSFNCKSWRVRFVVSVVRIVEQRVEWFLFSPWKKLFFLKFYFKTAVSHIMLWIIVILECTKSTTKPSIDFLRISALHEWIALPVWASRIREQIMWCKSEVSLNKYGHHISTNCFILVREILPLLKNIIQRLGCQ